MQHLPNMIIFVETEYRVEQLDLMKRARLKNTETSKERDFFK